MKIINKIKVVIILLLLINSAVMGNEKYGIIFAASNLKFVFPEIIKQFYAKYPSASVHIEYASSGTLTNSIIKDKRDYDIFFSADSNYPYKVYLAKRSVTKPKIYAQGFLILVIPTMINVKKYNVNVLKNKKLKYIDIANTLSSPYGKATVELLKNLDLFKVLKNKIKYTIDVGTAIDNVIWNRDAGVLPKSALYMLPVCMNKNKYKWIEINHNLYHPIMQAYVVSKKGLKNKNAMLFLDFLRSKKGQKILSNFGYKS